MRLPTFRPGWVNWGKQAAKADGAMLGDEWIMCDIISNLAVSSLVLVRVNPARSESLTK